MANHIFYIWLNCYNLFFLRTTMRKEWDVIHLAGADVFITGGTVLSFEDHYLGKSSQRRLAAWDTWLPHACVGSLDALGVSDTTDFMLYISHSTHTVKTSQPHLSSPGNLSGETLMTLSIWKARSFWKVHKLQKSCSSSWCISMDVASNSESLWQSWV